MESKMEKGFAELAEAITKLIKGVDELRKGVYENFQHVNARLGRIEDGVSDVPTIREEINELHEKVRLLERRVSASR